MISPEAAELIEAQARFIAEEQLEPKNASVWLAEVYDAIASLNFMPGRCSIAPENKYSDETIHMLPGQKRGQEPNWKSGQFM